MYCDNFNKSYKEKINGGKFYIYHIMKIDELMKKKEGNFGVFA